ncbi:MAG: LLM class F420-dependent oxidoreductase [Acidimicrobiales bacterium]
MDLGKVGVWWSGSWSAHDRSLDVAAELETLGYGALWSSGGFEPGLSSHFERLLASTARLTVASGIVSIWASSPEQIAPAAADLETKYPGRLLLGLGASHAPVVENYSRPYERMVGYLDGLDLAGFPVSADRRVLAALGPRMLALSGERALGAHPYFVTVQHTERARKLLGSGPLLAPEVAVVVERDPATARQLARRYMSLYLTLPNYTRNLRAFGYGDDDFAGEGSDRLVDAVVAWGDVGAVAARVSEHHDAGADHVCIQIVADHQGFPLDEYRELAGGLPTARPPR